MPIKRKIAVVLVVLVPMASGQAKQTKIGDFNHEQVVALAEGSYLLYGSNLLTARLIYHGMKQSQLDPWIILSLADFLTETQPQVAAVVYYYLYGRRSEYDEKLKERFMIMFSDAMYQYGLSKHKYKKGPLTLGDIYHYENFDFDIAALSKMAEGTIKGLDSIETFVLVTESSLGMSCGFVEKTESRQVRDYLPNNVHLTKQYGKWLQGHPAEIDRIQSMLKDAKEQPNKSLKPTP